MPLKTLKAALRTLGDAARGVRPGRTAQAAARKLDAAIAERLTVVTRLYDTTIFQSAARDAIRSECENWQRLRGLADPEERAKCVDSARTIAERCTSLLVNLEHRK